MGLAHLAKCPTIALACVTLCLASSACGHREFESQLRDDGGNLVVEVSPGEQDPTGRGAPQAGAGGSQAGAASSLSSRVAAGFGGVEGLAGAGGALVAGSAGAAVAPGGGPPAAGRGGDGGSAGSAAVASEPGGAGGRTPACIPRSEVCNGVDDDCDGLVDLNDPDSGLRFGFSEFDDVVTDFSTPARVEVLFATSAERYAVLWQPVGEAGGPRLYLLDPGGTPAADYLEVPEASAAESVALATNGAQVALAWAGGIAEKSVRLLIVDVASASRVGEVVDLGSSLQLGATSVTVAALDQDWYVAYRPGYPVGSAPVTISRVAAGAPADTQILESIPGDAPSVAAAGSTLGLAWLRDSDEDGDGDESWITFGPSLAALVDPAHFVSLPAAGHRYALAASATEFTLVPTTPVAPLLRLSTDGVTLCEQTWPESAYSSLLGLTGTASGVLMTAGLDAAEPLRLGVLRIADDCRPGGRFELPVDEPSETVGLAAAAGSAGAIAIRATRTALSVARASSTWCAPSELPDVQF